MIKSYVKIGWVLCRRCVEYTPEKCSIASDLLSELLLVGGGKVGQKSVKNRSEVGQMEEGRSDEGKNEGVADATPKTEPKHIWIFQQ